ncbi:hypothetical protein ACWELJ_27955 [Nocardia sp. NPDC004582]
MRTDGTRSEAAGSVQATFFIDLRSPQSPSFAVPMDVGSVSLAHTTIARPPSDDCANASRATGCCLHA